MIVSLRCSIEFDHINKPPPSSFLPKMTHIEDMHVFIHKYIDWILNIKVNGNCGFRAISTLHYKGEKNHTLVSPTFYQRAEGL